MNKLVYIMTLLTLTACGTSNNNSSNKNSDASASADLETTSSEVEELGQVSLGSHGMCLSLDFNELACADSLEELNDESAEITMLSVPVSLVKNSNTQIYQVSEDVLSSSVVQKLTAELNPEFSDSFDYILYSNVTDNPDNFFNYLNQASSDQQGVDASGDINKFRMYTDEINLPVEYVVNCSDRSTTFHLVTGDYGVKLTYTQNNTDTNIYEVKTSGMNEDRYKVISHSVFCTAVTPTSRSRAEEEYAEPELSEDVSNEAEDLSNDAEAVVDDLQDSAEDAGDAIGEALEQTGEAIEEGVETAAENVNDAADATANAVADGLDNVDEALDEGAAIVEGIAVAIGEQIAETADAAQDAVSEEIDEAREENQREEEFEDNEGGFRNWLRNLFN